MFRAYVALRRSYVACMLGVGARACMLCCVFLSFLSRSVRPLFFLALLPLVLLFLSLLSLLSLFFWYSGAVYCFVRFLPLRLPFSLVTGFVFSRSCHDFTVCVFIVTRSSVYLAFCMFVSCLAAVSCLLASLLPSLSLSLLPLPVFFLSLSLSLSLSCSLFLPQQWK